MRSELLAMLDERLGALRKRRDRLADGLRKVSAELDAAAGAIAALESVREYAEAIDDEPDPVPVDDEPSARLQERVLLGEFDDRLRPMMVEAATSRDLGLQKALNTRLCALANAEQAGEVPDNGAEATQ